MPLNFNKVEFIRSAGDRAHFLRDGLPQFAFAGRSNVGKSSVINRLVNRKNLAYVGASPGKTNQINYFLVDRRAYLVDLPGYGYAKVSRGEKRRWADLIEGYFAQDRDIRLVFSLVDVRHPPSQDDLMMLDFLIDNELPFVVVLTKTDKLSRPQLARRMEELRTQLPCGDQLTLLPFSAMTGDGVEEVREIIEEIALDGEDGAETEA